MHERSDSRNSGDLRDDVWLGRPAAIVSASVASRIHTVAKQQHRRIKGKPRSMEHIFETVFSGGRTVGTGKYVVERAAVL